MGRRHIIVKNVAYNRERFSKTPKQSEIFRGRLNASGRIRTSSGRSQQLQIQVSPNSFKEIRTPPKISKNLQKLHENTETNAKQRELPEFVVTINAELQIHNRFIQLPFSNASSIHIETKSHGTE